MNLLKKMLMGSLAAMLLLGGITEAMAQEALYSPDITKVNKFRYTFLWDVTLSMYGKRLGPNGLIPAKHDKDIYDQVEKALIKQIEMLDDPTAEIVVVPFQEHALVPMQISEWTVSADAEGRSHIISKIKSSKQFFQDNIISDDTPFVKSGPGTNILGSLKWVTDNVFDDRIDILFLLTDGGQGSGNVKTGKADLERYLNIEWSSFAKKHNVQGYYLMLTDTAMEGAPTISNDTPIKLIDATGLNFPVPTNIKLDVRKTLNVNDDYDKSSFVIGYEVVNGRVPSGSKIRFSEHSDYVTIDGEVLFSASGIEIPIKFNGSKSYLKSTLPEETTIDIAVEYSCDDPDQQSFTTVSPNVFKLKIVNKLQPTISISWK